MKLTVRLSRASALLLLVVLVLLGAAEAGASMLSNTGTLNPAPAAPDTGGTVVETESVGFTAPTYSGTLVSTVEINDPSNPFGVNDLTFIFQLQNYSYSTGTITHLSVNGFSNLLVDASYVAAAGQIYPAYFLRQGGATNGNTVGAYWQSINGTGPVTPGTTSTELVLHTNATTWVNATAAVIGGSITNPAAYTPVPEPASIILALSGLAAIIAIGRRRRAR